jgi:hypothetical protein
MPTGDELKQTLTVVMHDADGGRVEYRVPGPAVVELYEADGTLFGHAAVCGLLPDGHPLKSAPGYGVLFPPVGPPVSRYCAAVGEGE